MPLSFVPAWKQAPFLRLLPAFAAGVLFEWYFMCKLWLLLVTPAAATLALLYVQTATISLRFRLQWLTGTAIHLLLASAGALVLYFHHPANNPNSIASHYTGSEKIKAVLQEPLSAKKGSFKTTAAVKQLINANDISPVEGNIIVYFSPNVKVTDLSYGSIIIINKRLIPVKSSGNPGAFNYQQYCLFQKIAYQVFLQPQDFMIAAGSETRGIQRLIFLCKQQILQVFATYIKGVKERGLAEALLIGYKDELDKDLVQAYSNTGVVHIIAVSGMHLGIIYLLISRLLLPLQRKRSTKWMAFIIILAALWAFSLLAGAGPSVVRSALMFSIMLLADTFSKRSNIYNNLAASAFLLLCWNPFWLWDAGFQLSYAAVLSIVLFFKPVYNLLFVENKLLDAIWKLNAVTIAAQLLTLPFTLYHFHQFPNLFLLTNLLAVPLSTILLIGEIVLCIVSFIPSIAMVIGAMLNFLLKFMNDFIERLNALPFASWTHLYINVPQALLLAIVLIAALQWCLHRSKPAFTIALASLALFMVLRGYSFANASAQRQLIVYNINGKSAIDFMEGRHYSFTGDAAVQSEPSLRNFHVEPSRIIHRVSEASSLPALFTSGALSWFNGKHILIINDAFLSNPIPSTPIDLIILSKNPHIRLIQLLASIHPARVVADGSCSTWKMKQWQKDCDTLHIPFHSVAANGAFIMSVP